MASRKAKTETAVKSAEVTKPAGPQKPRGAVTKGRPSRGQGVVAARAAAHHASADPIADDFVDVHRIAAKQPHLGLPALASALEAAFRRMVARLGKK